MILKNRYHEFMVPVSGKKENLKITKEEPLGNQYAKG